MAPQEESDGHVAAPIVGRRIAPPALAGEHVLRPRLHALLAALLDDTGLVAVCATAGAGKTAAVVEAVAAWDDPVAWLTCEPSDAAVGRFVTYLQAAVARALGTDIDAASAALAGGLPATEAACLLAEAAGDRPLIVVIDGAERLTSDAWQVVGALARYRMPTTRLVLISRREPPSDLLGDAAAVRVVGDADLAFTVDEATGALQGRGGAHLDAGAAVEATGGWVTGVLFEAWRLNEHVRGTGGEADPLFGYLSSHILAQLSAGQRELLVTTSVLRDVTAAGATALGVADAGGLLRSLMQTRLPAEWHEAGSVLHLHPRFREYLTALLERSGGARLQAVRAAHAVALEADGLDEEAVGEFLAAGDAVAARPAMERAIEAVVERGDLAVAAGWLAALGPGAPSGAGPLTTAQLMLAVAGDDLGAAVRIADRLAAGGELDALVARSPRALALIGWAYLHAARVDDVRALLASAPPGPEARAVRYAARVVFDVDGGPLAADPPPLRGGMTDAFVLIGHYSLGRVSELAAVPIAGWAGLVAGPWVLAGLRATGQTQRSLALYEDARADAPVPVLEIFVGAELLLDAGRLDAARACIARGREDAERSGSPGLVGLNGLAAVRLALEVDRDPARATAILDELEHEGVGRFAFMAEAIAARRGLAALLAGDDAQARERLRDAVAAMRAGSRALELAKAAVWLAEAEWRGGDEAAADAAADIALEAAGIQGSTHLLLQALATFPAVLTRRLDAVAGAESPWMAVAAAVRAQAGRTGPDADTQAAVRRLHVGEFGGRSVTLDGGERAVGIAKAVELLSWMAATQATEVTRTDACEVLFDGRVDKSSRNYLRQVVHRLRHALGDAIELSDTTIAVADGVRLDSDSVALGRALEEAARLQGEGRLDAIRAALLPTERGPFLPGVRGAWAEVRDRELGAAVADAREDAAELALTLGATAVAEALAGAVVAADAYRERSWRILMRAAQLTGDEARVVALYRECQSAFAALGTEPSRATRQLVVALRR
ncbi:HTH-type transcriptional regulator MalT [Paraconexibacter sp. AEG42_29]|uniref:HTH-type transcriptional regulator MalT n=1 Tax=Paraconexibacter sp. AEG42_29 TaxID=2997339 RepID=A0AAU7APK7_9ACTN